MGFVDLREFDPEYKRFIPIENAEGQVEIVDLMAGGLEPFASVADVSYDLYTRTTTSSPVTIKNNDVNALTSTKFDSKKDNVFVAHGWNNNRNSDVNAKVRANIFINHDVNLFIVDWSGPANKDYLSAKSATVDVGKVIGAFITSIQSKYGLDGSRFILVGHSLGAHVVGNAGKAVSKQVEHIVGLDPAGPLYSVGTSSNRLDANDGKFVQIIHTNGNLLGMSSSIGDADIYPNGGNSQPGCGLDIVGTCAHSRAYEYFGEALAKGEVFKARQCNSYSSFTGGSCNSNTLFHMGVLRLNAK